MYITITETMFLDAFKQAGRADNFTYDALRALFDYFEDIGENVGGEPMELDVIAICCEYAQDHYTDIMQNYGLSLDDIGCDDSSDDEEILAAVAEWVCEETILITVIDDTILYQTF